jgi:uncharacterized protein (TIGR03435 family)
MSPQAPTESEKTFDVASIKIASPSAIYSTINASAPGDFSGSGLTLRDLIIYSFNIEPFQLAGGPAWMSTERFDIVAKAPHSSEQAPTDKPHVMNAFSLQKQRLRLLLEDRFHLVVHQENKLMPIYALLADQGKTKMPRSTTQMPLTIRPGMIASRGAPISVLVDNLSGQFNHILVDQTRLAGFYSFSLTWTPDDSPSSDSSAPSLRTALREQLGLRVVSKKGVVPFTIVDRVEKPSEN